MVAGWTDADWRMRAGTRAVAAYDTEHPGRSLPGS